MKKDEFATFLVYVLMIIVAIMFGLFWIRPTIENINGGLPIPAIVLVIISLVGAILFNAVILEFGHYLGAKMGHYRINSFVILGFGKKYKNGTKKVGFHKFSGLTGETKIAPEDVQKSRLGGYITLPMLFFLVEAIACAIMIAVGNANKSNSLATLSVVGIVFLGVAAMIVLYDYFPARLDEITDGYLMISTSKNINKVAFNNILLAEEAEMFGKPVPPTPIYEEITDFTYDLNRLSIYKMIEEKNYRQAIKFLELAIDTDKGLSKSRREHARCMKLGLLLQDPRDPSGKAMYEKLEDDAKTYLSSLESVAAVRCYILISSFIEQSEGECNYAIEKAEKALKNEDPTVAPYEKKTIEGIVEFVRANHPGWEVEELPWIAREKQAQMEAQEEEKEEQEEE